MTATTTASCFLPSSSSESVDWLEASEERLLSALDAAQIGMDLAERRRVGRCLRGMDHKLGYCGQDRLVLFYYEPRGEEVVWQDSRSCGFATGAWSVFMDEVAPLAERCKVDVGNHGSPGRHVLVVDRLGRRAYFVEKEEAMRLLVGSAESQGQIISRPNVEPEPKPFVAMSQKATPEATARLAGEVWEGEGGRMS